MYQLALIIHIIVSAALIALVLLQQGKGAEAGAAFGSGASTTMFGSRGTGNFLTRTTAILATIFFITCLSLGYIASFEAKKLTAPMVAPTPQPVTAPQEAPVTKPSDIPHVDLGE